MVQAVIFDVDGTLVDTVDLHARAWQDAFSYYGHEFAYPRIRAQIGKGGDQLMPVFLSPDDLQRDGRQIEQRRVEIMHHRYLPHIRALPGVRALFERVKADGARIVLASSSKADELAVYKQTADIADLVDAETSSQDADQSKPHPDIFEAALQRLPGIDRPQIVVVGDTPYDAQAAAQARLRTIGVLSGGFAEHDLREAGCIAIYRDPADLLARYDESPLAR